MNIDCDTCEVKGKACGDCFVSFLTIPVRDSVRQEPRGRAPRPMDSDQRRAVDLLVASGLVPPVRHVERRRAG